MHWNLNTKLTLKNTCIYDTYNQTSSAHTERCITEINSNDFIFTDLTFSIFFYQNIVISYLAIFHITGVCNNEVWWYSKIPKNSLHETKQ